jgi:hypothetical protein
VSALGTLIYRAETLRVMQGRLLGFGLGYRGSLFWSVGTHVRSALSYDVF